MHWPLTAVFPFRGGGTAFRAPVSADVRAPASAYAPGIPPPLGRHPTCRVAWWNTEFRFRGTTPVRRPAGTAAQRRRTLRSGSAPPTSSRLRRSPRPDPPTSAECADTACAAVRPPSGRKMRGKAFQSPHTGAVCSPRAPPRAAPAGSPRPEPRISAGRTSDPALSADKRNPLVTVVPYFPPTT